DKPPKRPSPTRSRMRRTRSSRSWDAARWCAPCSRPRAWRSPMDGEFARIGQPAIRVDGRAKVTGRAAYPSDEPVGNAAWAVVVADTFEAAREAAFKVRFRYEEEQPSATFGSPGVQEEYRTKGEHQDYRVGDAEGAYAAAAVRFEAEYGTPTQHHNPIELFTTTCVWQGKQLTIWEPSQFVYGLRATVAKQ